MSIISWREPTAELPIISVFFLVVDTSRVNNFQAIKAHFVRHKEIRVTAEIKWGRNTGPNVEPHHIRPGQSGSALQIKQSI